MILASGHYIQVRKSGTRSGHAHHTLHVVDFWESEAAFKAGNPPSHTEDFETQWAGPHPAPASRMIRILERYVRDHKMAGGSLLPDHHWSDEPDVHGILAHESMEKFKAVAR